MSAAEHQSPNVPSQPGKQSLSRPPQRPSLLQPPARPKRAASPEVPAEAVAEPPPPKPAVTVNAASVEPTKAPDPAVEAPAAAPVNVTAHPISPPSEPMQYRAIGLARGIYTPSEEQFNLGSLLTEEGLEVEAVLLGRVTSLIKKHIDLAVPHLWVVYPRTRQDEETGEVDLHLQIVGVWEPETLGMPGENPHGEDSTQDEAPSTEAAAIADDADAQADAATTAEPAEAMVVEAMAVEAAKPAAPAVELPSENYFSIRGEVLKYEEDSNQIVIKILQGAKRLGKPPKAFRLHVEGQISGKTVGYFWELDVERRGKILTLLEGHTVGIVPPKKKKRRPPIGGKGKRRPMQGDRPQRVVPQSKKPRIRPSAPVKSNPL